MTKDNIKLYLDYIRDQIQIIRKFSCKTADDLEKLANNFEKICDKFVRLPEYYQVSINLLKKVSEEQDFILEAGKREEEDLKKGITRPSDYYIKEEVRKQYKINFENSKKVSADTDKKAKEAIVNNKFRV